MAGGNGGRRRRGSLAAEAIIDAAVDLVEADGLASLTMTAVARALDVPGTSVHWHFRTRDDLVSAVAEQVTARFYDELPPIATERPWADELVVYFSAKRQQLLKSRAFTELSLHLGGVLFLQPGIRRRITERLEGEVGLLVRAGVEPSEAYRLYNVCSNYVRGFVILEHAHTRPGRAAAADVGPELLDPAAFPVMSQVPDLGALSWQDADHQFQLGIDLLVASIDRRLDTARRGA